MHLCHRIKWKRNQSTCELNLKIKELELDVSLNGRRVGTDMCWSGSTEEGWTRGWTKVEELKMLKGIWRSPSLPCLRSCMSLCTWGEVFSSKKWMIKMIYGSLYWKNIYYYKKIKMLLQENIMLKTCVQIIKHIVFNCYKPDIKFL